MLKSMKVWSALALAGGAFGVAGVVEGAAVVRSAAGADGAAVQAAVDLFRADISSGGANNGAGGGPFGNGRREINWDAGGLDAFQSPGAMPADFFNRSVQGSPRGAVFSTPGSGLVVSQRLSNAADPNLRFGDINPQYNTIFKAFSQQRLFAASGSVVIDTTFFVPGNPATPATVGGFGAVFTDVDLAGVSSIQYFGLGDQLLHTSFVQPADGGLSFLGVSFDGGERIARVRLTLGNTAMGANATDGFFDTGVQDVVATDDFFYSEPQGIPAPGAMALMAIGAAWLRRDRRRA